MLFIAGLVFLVDNHQTESLERQEYSGAGTKNHVVGILGELFLPYLDPLGIRILGVIDTQFVAKHTLQALHHLHRQCNLRQQI